MAGALFALLGSPLGVPLGSRALAAESAPVTSKRVTATLISDTDTVTAGVPFHVALRLHLAPGWHTYWSNPGDAGVAPDLQLGLPQGATASAIAWPAPSRQVEGPLTTYGYEGDVVLPVTVTAPTVGADGLTVTAHAQWLVCANICVPEEGAFTLALGAGPPATSAQQPLFDTAASRTPRPSPWTATIAPDGTLALAGPELGPASVRDAWFAPDAFGVIDGSAAQRISLGDGVLRLSLTPGSAFKASTPLTGVLTLRDATGMTSAYAITANPGPAAPAGEPGLVRLLAFALLGGLILNLMPCVFPILAMKALGLARLAGVARRHAAAHALSYATGVLVAFAALAAVLLSLRGAGLAAGWGFQFQSPLFVATMIWLLVAVGLNLSGVFAIGAGPSGIGQALAARGGHVGSFASGLLAVLVATPCTAPFMAVAIGAALAASPVETIAVFLAIGVGFALPYVLLATLPGLGRILPRPGPWMEIVRQGLAFPMYAAAVWLLWVLSQQSGPNGVLIGAAGAVMLGFAAWTVRLAQQARGGRAAYAGGVVALALLVSLLVALDGVTPAAPAADAGETFTAARFAALRAEGRPVFVNMTAAWCVTCLVNERVALAPAEVRDAFARAHVAYLTGDWTRQDADITAFLRAHGRDGVPLYIFYPAGSGAPTILPQILTPGTVLRALSAG